MTIEFTCNDCQNRLRTSDDKAGRSAACPSCGAELTVPAANGDAEQSPSDRDDFEEKEESTRVRPSSKKQECPMCGAEVSQQETSCTSCGERLTKRRRRRTNYEPHRGSLILGLAIGGMFCCPLIVLPALFMGHSDLAQIKENQMDPEGHGLTLAGVIISWIILGINVLLIGFYLLIVFLVIAGVVD